jgi:hypothetical protein
MYWLGFHINPGYFSSGKVLDLACGSSSVLKHGIDYGVFHCRAELHFPLQKVTKLS